MSYVNIDFIVDGKSAGCISSSLETFDSSPILVPKRILNKINKAHQSVEISFVIDESQPVVFRESERK